MTDETPTVESALLSMLKEDNKVIAYRPRISRMVGTTSAILLQQMYFRYEGRPFYKLKSPCSSRLYKTGDSWCEELGFSSGEFDTALRRISTKCTKGKSKTELLHECPGIPQPETTETKSEYMKRLGKALKYLIVFWTDHDRVTWYSLNLKLFAKLLIAIYIEKLDCAIHGLNGESQFIFIIDSKKTNKEKDSPQQKNAAAQSDDLDAPITEEDKQWALELSRYDGDNPYVMLCSGCGGYKQHSGLDTGVCDDCMDDGITPEQLAANIKASNEYMDSLSPEMYRWSVKQERDTELESLPAYQYDGLLYAGHHCPMCARVLSTSELWYLPLLQRCICESCFFRLVEAETTGRTPDYRKARGVLVPTGVTIDTDSPLTHDEVQHAADLSDDELPNSTLCGYRDVNGKILYCHDCYGEGVCGAEQEASLQEWQDASGNGQIRERTDGDGCEKCGGKVKAGSDAKCTVCGHFNSSCVIDSTMQKNATERQAALGATDPTRYTFTCKDCKQVVTDTLYGEHYPELNLCGECIGNHPEYTGPAQDCSEPEGCEAQQITPEEKIGALCELPIGDDSDDDLIDEPIPSPKAKRVRKAKRTPEQKQAHDDMFEAVKFAWKINDNGSYKIIKFQQFFLGVVKSSSRYGKIQHIFDYQLTECPADGHEVAAWALWYRDQYPDTPLPENGEKLRSHFESFRGNDKWQQFMQRAAKVIESKELKISLGATLAGIGGAIIAKSEVEEELIEMTPERIKQMNDAMDSIGRGGVK